MSKVIGMGTSASLADVSCKHVRQGSSKSSPVLNWSSPNQNSDLGANQNSDLGANQNSDLGANQNSDLGANQNSDLGGPDHDPLIILIV